MRIATALFTLALLSASPVLAQWAPPGTDQEGMRFRYRKCIDAQVVKLEGLMIPEAMKRLRTMGLQRFRLVHHREPELRDEIVPGRLTLVSNNDGQIVRAFCR